MNEFDWISRISAKEEDGWELLSIAETAKILTGTAIARVNVMLTVSFPTQVTKIKCSTAAAVAALSFGILSSDAAVIINEIDYDNVGTDNAEFIELYNNGLVTVDISGYVLVHINGNNNQVYAPITTIPASTSLAPGAYYVIGSTNIAARTLTFPINTDQIQNGAPDAVGLYSGGTFALTNSSTTNSGLLLDGIIYEGVADATNYPGFLALAAAFGDSNALNYSIGRDDTGSWALLSTPTPGLVNSEVVPEPATALLSALGCLAILRRRR